jgi:glycosyltransferase involved in cell wall biosynthesis
MLSSNKSLISSIFEKSLIVTPFFKPNIGGAETFAEDLAKALSNKYLVHICTIKWQKPIIWEGMDFKGALLLMYKLAFPLLKMQFKYRYERVYALGLIPSFLCFLFNIKFSSVILALYDFKKPNLFTYILNKAQKVYVEGLRGEEDMLKLGVKKDKIIKFQHWCDQYRFCYVPRNNERMKVLFVGRPIHIKGKHIIKECEKLTKDIDYEYVENVPYEDLPKHYQMADVCVVPSLYSEGFSRVVIESASCGCAVITSDKGALPELVKGFGKTLDPSPDSFAVMLTALNNNRKALDKLQINTILYAKEHFNEKNAEVFYENQFI